jgi:hypothetical protein
MTAEELNVISDPEGDAPPIMALDPAGQTIYAISQSGLTVFKLPQPIDQMPPAPGALVAYGSLIRDLLYRAAWRDVDRSYEI